jgi:hypothetical protein
MIAKAPEKASNYPDILGLVDHKIVLDRFENGVADLVALAIISFLPVEEQIERFKVFMSKTEILSASPSYSHSVIYKHQTISTDYGFAEATGIYEFPVVDAATFFIAAFEWKIAYSAFDKLFAEFEKIRNRKLDDTKSEALKHAKSNYFDVASKLRFMES